VKSLRSILCVLDGDKLMSDSAFRRAVSLAESNQAKLTLVDVVPAIARSLQLPDTFPTTDDLMAALLGRRRQALEELAKTAPDRVDVEVQVLQGTLFLETVRAVLRAGHDLVIKTAENPAWMTRLFGSQDMHLLRKCPCPVWLTRPQHETRHQKILAAVDFDPQHTEPDTVALNRRIIDFAIHVALSDSATLHVVHAWDAPEAEFASMFADDPAAAAASINEGEYARRQQAMDTLGSDLDIRLGKETIDYLKPRYYLVQGPASTQIPALVRRIDADLVVMGTIARTGIPGFLIGNTAEEILDQLACAVVAVKPDGFVSPVLA